MSNRNPRQQLKRLLAARRLAASLGLAISLFLQPGPAAIGQAPGGIRICNVHDQGFSVSWVSASAETGYIRYGSDAANLSSRADDDRGASSVSTTHHVTVNGLTAGATYYVDVHSGGTVDDNGGVHYQLTTGLAAAPGQPGAVYGRLARADGSPPTGILVYLTISDGDGRGSPGTSAPLSTIVQEGDQGYWFLNLGNARLPDGSGPFLYSASGDRLQLRFVAGPGQAIEITLDTGAASPAPPITVPAASVLPSPTPLASPIATPSSAPVPTPSAWPSATPPAPTPSATAASTVTPMPPSATATRSAPAAASPTPASTPTAGATVTTPPSVAVTPVTVPVAGSPAVATASIPPSAPSEPASATPTQAAPGPPSAPVSPVLPTETPIAVPPGQRQSWLLAMLLAGPMVLLGLVAILLRRRAP